jgi:Spy/CpxP family protein refolding chaperone
MKNRKMTVMVVAGLILVASASISLAQRQRGFGRPGGDLLRMKEYLGLTEQQVTDVEALREKHRAASEPILQELKAKREALRTALGSAEPNATTVGQMVIAVRALGNQLRALNEGLRADTLALLTPEQKDKLLTRGPGRPRGPRGQRGPRRPM